MYVIFSKPDTVQAEHFLFDRQVFERYKFCFYYFSSHLVNVFRWMEEPGYQKYTCDCQCSFFHNWSSLCYVKSRNMPLSRGSIC